MVEPKPSKIEHEAEAIAAQPSPFEMNVPPGQSTQTGTCTMVDDSTIFAVLPHMHLAGRHMKTTAGPSGVGATLLDADYQFTEQKYTTLDPPLSLKKGEQMHVECDYVNTTANTLGTGESTTMNEMCITFTYRYPALSMNADIDTSLGFQLPRGYCIK